MRNGNPDFRPAQRVDTVPTVLSASGYQGRYRFHRESHTFGSEEANCRIAWLFLAAGKTRLDRSRRERALLDVELNPFSRPTWRNNRSSQLFAFGQAPGLHRGPEEICDLVMPGISLGYWRALKRPLRACSAGLELDKIFAIHHCFALGQW